MIGLRDIWLLDLYVAVVDHGSMSQAARARFVATPSVSEAISKLERQVGVPLLIRGPTGCQTTAVGAELVAIARDLVADANGHLARLESLAPQRLRIGSTMGTHGPLITKLELPYRQHMAVSMGIGDPGAAVVGGDVHLALLMGPTRHDKHLHRVHVFDEPRVVVTQLRNVDPEATEVSLEEADRLEWPSIPPTADPDHLKPWLCYDVRPGPPPRQGPPAVDILEIRDWILDDHRNTVIVTTSYLARVFNNEKKVIARPLADQPPWPVDLVGASSNRQLVEETAAAIKSHLQAP